SLRDLFRCSGCFHGTGFWRNGKPTRFRPMSQKSSETMAHLSKVFLFSETAPCSESFLVFLLMTTYGSSLSHGYQATSYSNVNSQIRKWQSTVRFHIFLCQS